MLEQRLVVRLQNHWNLLKKDKEMPIVEQFNKEAIADMWPKCLLLKLENFNTKFMSYHFEALGSEAITMLGQDPTGQRVDGRTSEVQGIKITQHLQKVAETRQPQLDENQFTNAQGRLIKYRCCFLPFGSDKRGITHIVVGISHRVF